MEARLNLGLTGLFTLLAILGMWLLVSDVWLVLIGVDRYIP